MDREQMDRLLAEYATGGLSAEEKKILFAAALEDQELFDQLMEEDALRETIEMPGARNRLIDSLQEEEVPQLARAGAAMQMAAPAAPVAMPAPEKKRGPVAPVWLAWAAGIGVVFVSGAITYTLFDRPDLAKMAEVRPSSAPKDTKPFVAPPSASAPAVAKPVTVEEPPKIVAQNRTQIPAVNIPLPSVPPPALKEPEAAADKVAVSRAADAARNEVREAAPAAGVQQVAAAPPPPPVAQQSAPAPASAPMPMLAAKRPAAAPGALGGSFSREEKAKKEVAAPSVWRRTGDGVWTRVGAGESVGRGETVVVRYVVVSGGQVTLQDERGRRIARKNGRAGDELEFAVPAAMMATGDVVGLVVVEAGGGTGRVVLRLR